MCTFALTVLHPLLPFTGKRDNLLAHFSAAYSLEHSSKRAAGEIVHGSTKASSLVANLGVNPIVKQMGVHILFGQRNSKLLAKEDFDSIHDTALALQAAKERHVDVLCNLYRADPAALKILRGEWSECVEPSAVMKIRLNDLLEVLPETMKGLSDLVMDYVRTEVRNADQHQRDCELQFKRRPYRDDELELIKSLVNAYIECRKFETAKDLRRGVKLIASGQVASLHLWEYGGDDNGDKSPFIAARVRGSFNRNVHRCFIWFDKLPDDGSAPSVKQCHCTCTVGFLYCGHLQSLVLALLAILKSPERLAWSNKQMDLKFAWKNRPIAEYVIAKKYAGGLDGMMRTLPIVVSPSAGTAAEIGLFLPKDVNAKLKCPNSDCPMSCDEPTQRVVLVEAWSQVACS